jgi:hypothetical protein
LRYISTGSRPGSPALSSAKPATATHLYRDGKRDHRCSSAATVNDAAERLYLAAIAAAEKHYGTGVVEVNPLLNDLAVVYKYAARFDEPKRALGVVEAARGADHIDTATIWHNLGGVEHARGRFVDGEIYARRSVQIRETVLGPDHVAVAADLAALAALVQEQRRCDEAENLYRQASPFLRPRS